MGCCSSSPGDHSNDVEGLYQAKSPNNPAVGTLLKEENSKSKSAVQQGERDINVALITDTDESTATSIRVDTQMPTQQSAAYKPSPKTNNRARDSQTTREALELIVSPKSRRSFLPTNVHLLGAPRYDMKHPDPHRRGSTMPVLNEEQRALDAEMRMNITRVGQNLQKFLTLPVEAGHEDDPAQLLGVDRLDELILALQKNTTLILLNLQNQRPGPQFTPHIVSSIRNTKIEFLNYAHNQIERECIGALASFLTSCRYLHFLDLSHNALNDDDAVELSDALVINSSLHSLILSNNSFTAYGIESICQALVHKRSLTRLNLAHNSIGAAQTDAISKLIEYNPHLKRLCLRGNQIMPQRFGAALHDNAGLEVLDLGSNQLGDQGMTAISEGLHAHPTLLSLLVDDNQVTNKGAQAIQDCLQINRHLINVSLSNNQVDKTLTSEIYKLAQANSHEVDPDQKLKSLLHIIDFKHVQDDLLQDIKQIHQATLEGICRQLQHDEIQSLVLTDRNTCSVICDDAKHGVFSVVNMLSDEKKKRPTVRAQDAVLDYSGELLQLGELGTSRLSDGLAQNQSLTLLNISHHGIGDAGASALARALKNNQSVTFLNLAQNSITSVGATALASYLETTNYLSFLELHDNEIGSTGCQALARSLGEQRSVSTLGLEGNQVGDKGLEFVAKLLATNKALTCLNLEDNAIGSDGILALGRFLNTNRTLKSINLRRNCIQSTGLEVFSKALAVTACLELIDLGDNNISDEGVVALSDALAQNSTLTAINLAGNPIEDAGVQALIQSFEKNTTLRSIGLDSDTIKPNLTKTLSEVIARNFRASDSSFNTNYSGLFV